MKSSGSLLMQEECSCRARLLDQRIGAFTPRRSGSGTIALSAVENYLSPGRGADFSVLLGLRLGLCGAGHAAPVGEATKGENAGVGGQLARARSS